MGTNFPGEGGEGGVGVAFIVCLFVKYLSFGPGGLRAPCVLACAMRSFAIVITIVQSFSPLIFFSPSFAFDPLRGISRVRKFVSPNILA